MKTSTRLSMADAIAINNSTITSLCSACIGSSRPYTFIVDMDLYRPKEGDILAVKISDGSLRLAEVVEPELVRVAEVDFWPGFVVANLSSRESETEKVEKFINDLSKKIDAQLVKTEVQKINKELGVDIHQLSISAAREMFD